MYKKQLGGFYIIFVGVLLLLSSGIMYAQDITVTPRPTKTATPQSELLATPEESEPAPTEQVIAPTITLEEPFIQADLQILSGNVQRPNGLVWHNGMIYAACNGDWTIYEIQADSGSTITYLWGIRNAHTLMAEDDTNGGVTLWVPDFQQNSLIRISQRTMSTVATGLEGPWGIVAHNENFLVSNLLGNSLVEISREGESRTLVSGLRSPAGLVINGSTLYIANNGSARRAIEWADTTTLIAEGTDPSQADLMQPLVSGLQSVTGLAQGADGMLYFAYSLGTRGVVGRVDPVMCQEQGGCSNSDVEIVLFTDLAAPLAGLTLSPDMRLYIHTIFSPDIYYVDLATPRTTASLESAS